MRAIDAVDGGNRTLFSLTAGAGVTILSENNFNRAGRLRCCWTS